MDKRVEIGAGDHDAFAVVAALQFEDRGAVRVGVCLVDQLGRVLHSRAVHGEDDVACLLGSIWRSAWQWTPARAGIARGGLGDAWYESLEMPLLRAIGHVAGVDDGRIGLEGRKLCGELILRRLDAGKIMTGL